MREHLARVGQVVVLLGLDDFVERAALERRLAGKNVVESEAEGINIAAAVGLAAFDLLRGDIGGGAFDDLAGFACGGHSGDARQPEVRDFDRTIHTEQNVAGFDVAVDQAGLAPGGIQRAGNDIHQLERLAVRHPLVLRDPLRQIRAVHIFHDVEQRAVVLAKIHDPDNGRM
ncbi:MAG: hypothetical protein BWX54_01451 [Verrucomicrobia bacterium ADurb.Bin018]|nr:MAG: hypothetical protein BWX54_01451 [Verrucomicrobia bacterium ADurb.Bin018]